MIQLHEIRERGLYGVMGHDGCACVYVNGEDWEIDVHCHRTDRDCNCEYAGVHAKGNVPIGLIKQIADEVSKTFRCETSWDWKSQENL